MSLRISNPSFLSPESNHVVSTTPSSTPRAASLDDPPKTTRHDLSNMALLFAMGGSYPGCWRALDDQDDENDSDQTADREWSIDEREGNKNPVGETCAPLHREERKAGEERPRWARNIELALHPKAIDRREQEERKDWFAHQWDFNSTITAPPRLDGEPRKTENKTAKHERSGLSMFTKKKSLPRPGRREWVGTTSSYVPTGVPTGFNIFARRCDQNDEREGDLIEWYDDLGFLNEDTHSNRRPITPVVCQQSKQKQKTCGRSSQDEDRYFKSVENTDVTIDPPFTFQDVRLGVARQSTKPKAEPEGCSLDSKGRFSTSLCGYKERETSGHSLGLHQLQHPSAANQDKKCNPEVLVPFREFAQEPGRFLRNAEKLRRQEEGRRALLESTLAAHSNTQQIAYSYSWRTGNTDPCAAYECERSVSPFSWKAGVIEELEVSRTEINDTAERCRYTFNQIEGTLGDQRNTTHSTVVEDNDSEIADMSGELIEPICLVHGRQPVSMHRSVAGEPDLHQHMPAVEIKRLDEHSSEDFWSFTEDDDQDFTATQQYQQQGLVRELRSRWARMVSRKHSSPNNSSEYIQNESQMCYGTEHQPDSRWRAARRGALSSDLSPCNSPQRPAHNYSMCLAIRTQKNAIDPSCRPIESWSTEKAQGKENDKRLPSETSSMMTAKKSGWCWPFRRGVGSPNPKLETSNQVGVTRKRLRKPKANRGKATMFLLT